MSDIRISSSNLENLEVGPLNARWSARGDRILRYHIDFRHKVLNVHKELGAPELFILQSKVDALMASWDAKYEDYKLKRLFQSGKGAAEEATVNAGIRLEALHRILDHTLAVNDTVDWETLKDYSTYKRPKSFPESKPALTLDEPPQHCSPEIGFVDVIFGRKRLKLQEAEEAHGRALEDWKKEKSRRTDHHIRALQLWEERQAAFWAEHDRLEKEFLEEQCSQNAVIDQLRAKLADGDPQAVVEHASLVLDASDYAGLFEKSFDIQFRPDDKLLLIAYSLPCPDTLPTVKSVKFIKATGEMKETHISEREKKANFEAVAYQICLRTIHEIIEADEHRNINRVLFNGYVNFIDRRSGREARSCLISLLTSRDDFERIDLARVEPKSCFKSLKGVSAAQLSSLTAIPPIMEMDKEDRRFVGGREVGSGLSAETNIASMSWEDFEHLVRELFEKEFQARGGEVKVTQASSDGGVDAIAFDPDPISGGKIVIQAKRYTKTVGVSAVRDLYGTVMNEGASKGILVTTADYGPDANKFAAGKPLTLLSGSHLLHLLERHGYKAKIDLREARETARAASMS
jgi:restriction system protein